MTIKLGLIGHPVSHSISPVLHAAALRHLGRSGEYLLFDILEDQIATQLTRLEQEGFTGVNVTIPHKQAVIPHLGSLTSAARQCEAVNTIGFLHDGIRDAQGHNTDMGGFLHALNHHGMQEQARKKVCILGAGGAARAALWALNSIGTQQITVLARNREKVETLLRQLQLRENESEWRTAVEWACLDAAGDRLFDLLVNCTPLGLMEAHPVPTWVTNLLEQSLSRESAVFDMVYGKSLFGEPCKKLQLQFADGLEMLIGQAALAFEYWTGAEAPVSVMRNAVNLRR